MASLKSAGFKIFDFDLNIGPRFHQLLAMVAMYNQSCSSTAIHNNKYYEGWELCRNIFEHKMLRIIILGTCSKYL